jgi:hypothetical protein
VNSMLSSSFSVSLGCCFVGFIQSQLVVFLGIHNPTTTKYSNLSPVVGAMLGAHARMHSSPASFSGPSFGSMGKNFSHSKFIQSTGGAQGNSSLRMVARRRGIRSDTSDIPTSANKREVHVIPSAFLHFHLLLSRDSSIRSVLVIETVENRTPRTLSLLLFFPYCKHTNLSAGHTRKPIR